MNYLTSDALRRFIQRPKASLTLMQVVFLQQRQADGNGQKPDTMNR
jgi:hypothetical protein